MGYTQIRRLCKNEARWTDKSASKHKHIFSVHAVARLKRSDGRCEYFDVMKCKHCNSFKGIPREGSSSGFISGDNYESGLPIIKLKSSHSYIIGFKDATLE